MTKAKSITFHALELALTAVGFVAVPTAGHHKVFRHEVTDTIVLLPLAPADSDVDAIHLAAVRRMVDERGVLDGDAFESLLWTTAQADGQPSA